MRSADSRSRVLSVSRKDRGAILPVGRFKGDVFWYAGGIFTTSAWYRSDTLPGWVREWNASEPVKKVAGWTWNPLLKDPAAYPEPDSVAVENGGRRYRVSRTSSPPTPTPPPSCCPTIR